MTTTIKNSFTIFFFFLAGINKQIAVDAAYYPIVSADEPRAIGLPQDPHGNTMLSCLSSGFLCPLINKANQSDTSVPKPGSRHTGKAVTMTHAHPADLSSLFSPLHGIIPVLQRRA